MADEILIVDTGSDDGTPQLAESLGAMVIHWQWQQDFAAARNVSLTRASSDWILVLDADDALEAIVELQACLKLDPDFKEAQDNLIQLENWLQRQNN